MPVPNQGFLLAHQYNDASKLRARQQLHARFSTNGQHLNWWMFEQLDLPPIASVLELGCGPGDLWSQNIERIPEGWDVTLTDFSPGMIEEAERTLRNSGRSFQFAVVDAQEIPYGDGSLDAVIANFMLYHVPDRQRALSQIARVLKPGGHLYAMTNGHTHLQRLRELVEILAPPAERQDTPEIAANSFGLENGAEQLAAWFPQVDLRRFDDALVVTEAEPLVAYVLSSIRAHEILSDLPEHEIDRRVAQLRAALEHEIAERGSIRIAKDPGLFIAGAR